MAGIQRHFLGWQQPLLHSVIDFWQREVGNAPTVDLRHLTVVLPVRSAIERLKQLLHERFAVAGRKLHAPRMLTVGGLPEQLYQPSLPLAGELQQTLAWTQVLRASDPAHLQPLMPVIPPTDALAAWVDMASLLRRLTEELAADGWHPAKVVEQVENEAERARWRLIATLHDQYLAALQHAELSDPHVERRAAVEQGRCSFQGNLQLIGCVDLGEQSCQLLQAVSNHVTALIAAPESSKRLFDRFGRTSPSEWTDHAIEIPDESLISAGGAQKQASAAVAQIQNWQPSAADSTGSSSSAPNRRAVVGITDDAFAPWVDTELKLAGFSPYRSAGTTLTRTAPGRLLALVRDFVNERNWETLAALVRHADLLPTLTADLDTNSMSLLGTLDQFRNDHLPLSVDEPLPTAVQAKIEDPKQTTPYEQLPKLLAWVQDWLQPLDESRQTLTGWCEALSSVLTAVYGSPQTPEEADGAVEVPGEEAAAAASELSDDTHAFPDQVQLAADRIARMLDRLAALPEALDLPLSVTSALDMLLQRIAEPLVLSAPPTDNRVDIIGWLDLILDDSPTVVVVGLNQPFVPQAVTADPFLPGSLRSQLRVQDNERRYARDAYALQILTASRQQQALIVGRFGPDQSPTPPSRLLAACEPETTVRRIARLLAAPASPPSPHSRWESQRESTDLPLPTAIPSKPLRCVSVTAFRDYLACPLRFYFRHVLKMRPLDDTATELAANQFGDLVHAAVENYGQCDDKNLTEPTAIRNAVIRHLHAYAEAMYGAKPSAAVQLQINQAEIRLAHFAQAQAQRMADGWRIVATEDAVTESDGVGIEVEPGKKLLLKGRIDRIDQHIETGQWAILDYKTHGHKPLPKHIEKSTGKWIDLQLPLYLHLLSALNIDDDPSQVEVGYFNVAEKAADCGVNLAEFTPENLQEANALAREVARGILEQDFALRDDGSTVMYDDYGMILQTGIADNLLANLSQEAS